MDPKGEYPTEERRDPVAASRDEELGTEEPIPEDLEPSATSERVEEAVHEISDEIAKM